jgi:hypothetical protein
MPHKEANKLIAEAKRRDAESQNELRKLQQGIEALRRVAEETFPGQFKKIKKSQLKSRKT